MTAYNGFISLLNPNMPEPTLSQVFGANASQTSTQLIISKADLLAVGLTATANNTAESLVVAILLLAGSYLNSTNQTSVNTDMQVTIDNSGYPSIATRNNANYRQITYNVNLQKLDVNTTIDPDDY